MSSREISIWIIARRFTSISKGEAMYIRKRLSLSHLYNLHRCCFQDIVRCRSTRSRLLRRRFIEDLVISPQRRLPLNHLTKRLLRLYLFHSLYPPGPVRYLHHASPSLSCEKPDSFPPDQIFHNLEYREIPVVWRPGLFGWWSGSTQKTRMIIVIVLVGLIVIAIGGGMGGSLAKKRTTSDSRDSSIGSSGSDGHYCAPNSCETGDDCRQGHSSSTGFCS